MKKYNYHVAIINNDNTVSYVTKVDNASKQAWWANGKKAMPMTKIAAEDLLFGLACNGFHAMICTVPTYIELQNN